MSASNEVLRRHRNLTVPLNTRISKEMDSDFTKTAKRLKLSRSVANREAVAKWIESNKPTA
jgi:hypothetical protein